ncbi:p-loop containing nucleoside triphosphate hydrolase protein [Favolaschia claudopus]|uniref:P-loop containing nucleoside triphosphate hydrolase protein n=1 Tax=Favolaschia claudopus TaxID=2862362 RepID=A0AAW0DAG7_9AGAR
MAKRRANVDSDEENGASVNGSPASKRARTVDSDDEPAPPTNGRRASKGKGKARHKKQDDSEDSASEDEAEDIQEADRIFEEEHEESIRAALESRRGVHGGIADSGIIESIEMHHFMCHKYLTFSFGPQINFIIGHNGSGKSAVLSAITVALGGKANSTGRGNGLKSFIREGQPASEVTISLKNQGEEAYKPKEYGKSIIITRRFTKEGNSSWKIRSKDGKLVSTKKDELAAICDHMNIQVDNPMNVLTQDAARQFLSASAPTEKYKFFLRGTQLSQLSEEYDTCLANITTTTKVLTQKKEAIPDLKAAFREASTRFEEAARAREQKKKVDELKKELAWAHVAAKEQELQVAVEKAAREGQRVPKIKGNLEKVEADIAANDEEVMQLEHDLEALGDRQDLQDKKNAISAEIKVHKATIANYNNQTKTAAGEVKINNKQIEEYQAAIDKETKRLERDTESKRQETQHKLASVRAEMNEAEEELKAIQSRKSDVEEEMRRHKEAGSVVEAKQRELQAQIMNCDSAVQTCTRADQDRYAAYGKNIQKVLEQIDRTQWYGEKPLGPFGIHVKVRDNQWAELLRSQLGSLLTSFAVTETKDLNVLRKILAEYGNKNTVFVHRPDLFDYSRGEPPADVLTVLRALDITNPYVLRIMINKSSIESRVLAPRRADAARILNNMRSGTAWTLDNFTVTRYPEGGESSLPLNSRSVHPMLLVGSASDELQRWKDQKVSKERELQAANASLRGKQAEYNVARQKLEALNHDEKVVDDKHHKAKGKLRTLQNEMNEEMPAELGAIQHALEQSQKEKDVIIMQIEELTKQKTKVDDLQKDLVAERERYQAEINEFAHLQEASKVKIENAVAKRTQNQVSINHWKKKLEEEQAKVKTAEDAVAALEVEYQNWTKQAEEYCARVPANRTVDVVKRALDSTQAALKERERRHGASVEDMTIEVNKAKDKLDKAETELKQMTSLNKALKASLIVRLSRWQEFRRHIALRCKLVFGYHLSQRGYYGKVLFDHEKGTLQLKVQTDDQVATQGGRDKDPLSLSGGEKSFSTICLLLSLWESIGCPLRCLDEFDVFMDAVNRRISMKMMIDTANQSDKKQYVLITPQDMNNVVIGPTVRVHRMTDPERGQGVLGFGN